MAEADGMHALVRHCTEQAIKFVVSADPYPDDGVAVTLADRTKGVITA
jgi:hypothetical protein